MRRIVLLILLSILPLNVSAQEIAKTNAPIVFTYHIPDEEDETEQQEEIKEDIISDDVTEDTSGILEEKDDDEDYLMSDLYSDVLQGYAEYNEEDETEGIILNPTLLTLNIHKPFTNNTKKYTSLKTGESLYDNIHTRFNGAEYSIAPISGSHASKNYRGFSAGTIYTQGIDYGELEQSSGIFTRYEYKRFALTTTFTKTINTTNNNYNDNFYITPELKLNQYLTIKNNFSADTVKKRNKAELVLSINPFGKRDEDRMRLNLSASETYDEVSNTFWNQFKFMTTFKL